MASDGHADSHGARGGDAAHAGANYGLGLAYYNLKNKPMVQQQYDKLKYIDAAQAAKLLEWLNKMK